MVAAPLRQNFEGERPKLVKYRFSLARLQIGGEEDPSVLREGLGHDLPAVDPARMEKAGEERPNPSRGVAEGPIERLEAIDVLDRGLESREMDGPAAGGRSDERVPGGDEGIVERDPAHEAPGPDSRSARRSPSS